MSAPSVAEMARAVARELEDGSRWCAGEYAYASDNDPIDPEDENACRLCALGHLIRLYGYSSESRMVEAYKRHFGGDEPDVDNDDPARGREFVRARLLELAEAHDAG